MLRCEQLERNQLSRSHNENYYSAPTPSRTATPFWVSPFTLLPPGEKKKNTPLI